jgi:mono/diheme cytochrome c family protein
VVTIARRLVRGVSVLTLLGLAGCGDAAPSLDGAALFEANCSLCHGAEAGGTDAGPPLVHEVYEPSHDPDDAFRTAVAQGVSPHHWDFGPMPPVAGGEEAEVDGIISFVRQLQRDAGID